LSKDYNKLWVFGDSYTTPNVCVEPKDSFWGLVATHAGIETIVNCSRPVNSFDSVLQLVLGLQSQFDWQNDLLLIGMPPLERITVFDDYKNTQYLGHTIDTETWQATNFDIACHRSLVCLQNYGKDKTLIIHDDRSWLETQVLRSLFLLTNWLDRSNANYVIINLSKQLDKSNQWGPSEFFLPYVENHNRCVVFEDSYHAINLNKNPPADYDEFGWDGHHGAIGNKYFFENSLWPRLKKCNLV
jgi:hypothetical protein